MLSMVWAQRYCIVLFIWQLLVVEDVISHTVIPDHSPAA